jgi:hypothetical protein
MDMYREIPGLVVEEREIDDRDDTHPDAPSSFVGEPGAVQPLPPTTDEAYEGYPRAKALYRFAGIASNELSMEQGQILVIIEKHDNGMV